MKRLRVSINPSYMFYRKIGPLQRQMLFLFDLYPEITNSEISALTDAKNGTVRQIIVKLKQQGYIDCNDGRSNNRIVSIKRMDFFGCGASGRKDKDKVLKKIQIKHAQKYHIFSYYGKEYKKLKNKK